MIKKIFSFLLLLALLIGCTPGGDLADYQNYANADYGISYPPDWKFSALEGGLMAFSSPQKNAEDQFVENVNVYVTPAQPGLSLDDYVAAGLEQLPQVIPGFKLLEVKETTHSGESARRLSYESNTEAAKLRLEQLLLIKNNKFFTVTLAAEQASYSSYSDEWENMLKSFNPK